MLKLKRHGYDITSSSILIGFLVENLYIYILNIQF